MPADISATTPSEWAYFLRRGETEVLNGKLGYVVGAGGAVWVVIVAARVAALWFEMHG